jgi:hypothetical protein
MSKYQSGNDAAQALLDFVNCGSDADFEAFAKYITERGHRTLQQRSMGVMLECIDQWADKLGQGVYDGRNEATVMLAQKIKQGVGADWKYVRKLPFI